MGERLFVGPEGASMRCVGVVSPPGRELGSCLPQPLSSVQTFIPFAAVSPADILLHFLSGSCPGVWHHTRAYTPSHLTHIHKALSAGGGEADMIGVVSGRPGSVCVGGLAGGPARMAESLCGRKEGGRERERLTLQPGQEA